MTDSKQKSSTGRQVAFLFEESGDLTRNRIGGKAESLAAMLKLGMPVPPGFVLTTGVCRAYLEHKRLPNRVIWQVQRCMRELEKRTGRQFGSNRNPLLVSVRSGAPVSMPGMMDTILNLGMNDNSFSYLARKTSEVFACDTYGRFQSQFEKIVGQVPPQDSWEQLWRAIDVVCKSWLNPRAIEYRKAHGIPDDMGTAVTVQAMVFGNLDENSGTGVLFSRNVSTGANELYGEFLPRAQGEDVVSGKVTPLPISEFADRFPRQHGELAVYARELESHYSDVVDIEFTLENGKLWTLQCRPAKRTPVANIRFAVQAVWEKRVAKSDAVARISEEDIQAVERSGFDPTAMEDARARGKLVAHGLPASPGAASGMVVFSSQHAQQLASRGESAILFRPDTNPDDLLGMMAASALITAAGGTTSHAAVVARALGKPAVVGIGNTRIDHSDDELGVVHVNGLCLSAYTRISVDGKAGQIFLGDLPLVASNQNKEVNIFLKWVDGISQRKLTPKPAFVRVNEHLCANTMLNDFYLADAMASAAAGTELAAVTKKLRRDVHQEVADAIVAYLILSVGGEVRHTAGHAVRAFDHVQQQMDRLTERFGVRYDGLIGTRHKVQMSVVAALQNSSREDIGEFLRLTYEIFSCRGVWHGAIGGSKWAVIAKAALDYVSGAIDASVFVDHAFDLRHNGGCLFDKHDMFRAKTYESILRMQLDAKKSARTTMELEEVLRVLHRHFSPAVSDAWNRGQEIWRRGAQS